MKLSGILIVTELVIVNVIQQYSITALRCRILYFITLRILYMFFRLNKHLTKTEPEPNLHLVKMPISQTPCSVEPICVVSHFRFSSFAETL